MSKFNWWNDKIDRDYVLKKLEGINVFSLYNLSGGVAGLKTDDGPLNINEFNEKRKLLADKTKDKLSPKKFDKLFKHATQIYRQILLYNKAYEYHADEEVLKVINKELRKLGIIFSCQNLKSYAERVADFAKTLKELGITETDEVVEILPILRDNIIVNIYYQRVLVALIIKKVSALKKELSKSQDAALKQEFQDVELDFCKDGNTIMEKINNDDLENIVDEVETKLNEMS